jgi:hypothetical protein
MRPMCRPSSRARRRPARTRSMIRLRSSSATAATIVTTARPSGAAGIDLLAEVDELDVEPAELVDILEDVPHRPGQPVEGPDQDHVQATAARLAHHQIQSRPARLRAADGVGLGSDDVEAAQCGHGPKV